MIVPLYSEQLVIVVAQGDSVLIVPFAIIVKEVFVIQKRFNDAI